MYTSYSETPAIPHPCCPYYTYIAVLVPQYCPIYQLHNHSALTQATSEDYIKPVDTKLKCLKPQMGVLFKRTFTYRVTQSHLTLEAIFRL